MQRVQHSVSDYQEAATWESSGKAATLGLPLTTTVSQCRASGERGRESHPGWGGGAS